MNNTYTHTISYQETMGTENITYFFALFQKLLHHFWVKLVASVAVLPAFFFDSALRDGMMALAALVIFDFLSGVFVAKKTGEQIKSAKVFRTALKMAVYFTLISSGHLVGTAGLPFLQVDAIILTFLAVTELVSIIENAGRAGYAIPQKLLNQLRNFRDKK